MTFTALHIGLTALLCGVLAMGAAWWRLPRDWFRQAVVVGVLTAAAVFLWRISANMPQLNDDGLPGFSANDWAAPMLAYLVVDVYGKVRKPADLARFGLVQVLVGLICLAVNVVTI